MNVEMKNRRREVYQPLIDAFKKEIEGVNIEGITGPHLPVVGNYYAEAKYKFVFCGIETLGYDLLSKFVTYDNEELVTLTDDKLNDNIFLSYSNNNHANFWGFVFKFLSKFYKIDLKDLRENKYPEILHSFIWTNSNSIERYTTSSKGQGAIYSEWEKVKTASAIFDDLDHIINSCSPKVIFICNKKCNENYFLNNSSNSDSNNYSHTKFYAKDSSEGKDSFEYYHKRNSNVHIFKLPHPKWMDLRGKGVDAYIDSIIKIIENHFIFGNLPSKLKDWHL